MYFVDFSANSIMVLVADCGTGLPRYDDAIKIMSIDHSLDICFVEIVVLRIDALARSRSPSDQLAVSSVDH